ncbi:MAG TPA: cytochrome c oxidase subunit 3, partial [Gemmatimonadales bacterium]|nr:cytochrome c oxidase subunit 3 [Gemmatimonadales bacterium]
LLASSATLSAGTRRLRGAWASGATAGIATGTRLLQVTLGLGALFIAGQVLAWRALAAQGIFLATNPGSGYFYVLTGLHALHLLGGIGGMLYALARLRRSDGPHPSAAVGGAALYWHFMDVLWLYLLLLLALWL